MCSSLLDVIESSLRISQAQIVHNDDGSFPSEGYRDGSADARAGPGDERYAILQFHAATREKAPTGSFQSGSGLRVYAESGP